MEEGKTTEKTEGGVVETMRWGETRWRAGCCCPIPPHAPGTGPAGETCARWGKLECMRSPGARRTELPARRTRESAAGAWAARLGPPMLSDCLGYLGLSETALVPDPSPPEDSTMSDGCLRVPCQTADPCPVLFWERAKRGARIIR